MGHFDGTGQKVVGVPFCMSAIPSPSFTFTSSMTAPRFACVAQFARRLPSLITPIAIGWSVMGLWVDDGAREEGLNV